jgi:peptide/nickel transport system permease protein
VSATWLARRLLLAGYTMLVVSVLVFAITQVLPADAATTLLGENATPEALAAVRLRLGLSDPVLLQYWRWLAAIVHGNFGTSMRTSQPVAPMMLAALSRSLLLAGLALLLTVLVAIPLGLAAALRRGSATDLGIGLLTYVGVSLPEFVIATLLLILFSDRLRWLPATGYVSLSDDLASGLAHLALPVLTVSVIMMAHVSRMVRSETIDVLGSDYISAARLRGLSEPRIVLRHTLRNALLPVITVISLDVGYLLGGIIVVEEIFALPGIGRQLLLAITSRDLPSIQAGALIMAATYAVASTLADVAYALLDRRIVYD